LWTVPFALGFVVGSMVSPRLARAMHPAYVMTGGLALAAAGYLLLTQVSSTSGPGLLVAGMLIQSLGFAPVYTLTNDLIIGAAPPERAGAAAGISETASELGGALGIALLGSLATAVYGSALAPETLPQALEMTAAICAVLTLAMMGVILSLLRPARAPA
jgi:MFS transporter, DHA2 family, multidrug resistance protein